MQNKIAEIINNKQLKDTCAIFLITNLQDAANNPYYAFYAIRADIVELFLKKFKQEKFNIEKYGIILESIPGQPSEKILAMVRENFGDNAVL